MSEESRRVDVEGFAFCLFFQSLSMTRTYQSRRRKPQPKVSAQIQDDKFSSAYFGYANQSDSDTAPCFTPSCTVKTDSIPSIVLKYHRVKPAKPAPKRLSNSLSPDDHSGDKKSRNKKVIKVPLTKNRNIRTTRVTAKKNQTDCNGKENRSTFRLRNHYKDQDHKQFQECQIDVISRDESVDSTTSFLSALSLQQHNRNNHQSHGTKQSHKSKVNKVNREKKSKPLISKTDTEVTTSTIQSDAITLDDICNDAVDIEERLYDPESLTNITDPDDNDQWPYRNELPSWVPNDFSKRIVSNPPSKKSIDNTSGDSPSKKRKRENDEEVYNSPPIKKRKSPHIHRTKSRISDRDKNASKLVMSTVRKNKRRSRRRSSIRGDLNCSNISNLVTPAMNGRKVMSRFDQIVTPITDSNLNVNVNLNHILNQNPMETPIGSIRTQRIHRLNRKSNTDLLMDVLFREDLRECHQMKEIQKEMKFRKSKSSKLSKTITFNDLNGLQSVGRMDSTMEKTCLFLLKLGADPLWLNQDGVSPIYIAMHYTNSYAVISVMIRGSVIADPSELNQTYVFAKHGTLSLLDIALRIGEVKTVRLCLENDMMPTLHSRHHAPTVQLLSFCTKNRMLKLGTRVLKEQWFDAVENLDIEYLKSILCHGIDVDIKKDGTTKSALYWLVEQPFDVYDEEDAKDQYETIECLLKNGAVPIVVVRSKSPMLIYPLQRSGRWNVRLVDLLLVHGVNMKLKVGETAKSLYQYAKDNCVCDEILKIITTFYKESGKMVSKAKRGRKSGVAVTTKVVRQGSNGGGVGRKRVKENKVKLVEVAEIDNPDLEVVMQTKNVVKKAYSRNRKSVKRNV